MEVQDEKYLSMLEDILELEPDKNDDTTTRLKNIYLRVADYIESTHDLFEDFLNDGEIETDPEEEDEDTEEEEN